MPKVKAKPAGKKRAVRPKQYLSKVMFMPADVVNRNFNSDNVECLGPVCVDTVKNGDRVAVYEFVGVKTVSKVPAQVELLG